MAEVRETLGKFILSCLVGLLIPALSLSAAEPDTSNIVSIGPDPFLQIDPLLPSPNEARLASGAPGPAYWQQRVDYQIEATLDEDRRVLRGRERIHYENHSPHPLPYLWLQLDLNQFSPGSDTVLTRSWKSSDEMAVNDLQRLVASTTFDGSMQIRAVRDGQGNPLKHTIIKGLMRVDLPTSLPPGGDMDFEVAWENQINNTKTSPGRTGYEVLDDGQILFGLAMWYPRLCAYTDYGGWRIKQFIRFGEFTLEFGNFDVRLTVPADHVLAATGQLVNADEVLSPEKRQRLTQGDTAAAPVFVVTREEADAKRQAKASTDLTTWHFRAENVRDFAFASSRAFLWQSWGCRLGDRIVRCAALFPREGMPLWDQYAVHAVAQTIEVYSEVTGIPYPWPHSTSVMGVHASGMEWPMINFNGPRPEKDGTYSEVTKNRVIAVIIHETGHNWFPMIINSDERHWMWLDEGLNRFVEGFAERRWAKKFDKVGQPRLVTEYLTGETHQPIMTQSDNLQDVSKNAYWKTSVGLTMLRETILGRELFDFAFKEYCRRWAFKRATPADLFRTFEDASGIDLDWFWRGWFFSTSHCDMELVSVTRRILETEDPAREADRQKKRDAQEPENLTKVRDAETALRVEKHQSLKDFYDTFEPHAVTEKKQESYQKFLDRLTPDEKEMLSFGQPLYEVQIRNHGEMPMPIILQMQYEDGSQEMRRYPAEIWSPPSQGNVSLLLVTPKQITSIMVDPYNETADPNMANNRFPARIEERDLQLISPEKKIENPIHDELELKRAKNNAGEAAPEKSAKPSTP